MNVHKNARLTPRGREWIVELSASGCEFAAWFVFVDDARLSVVDEFRRYSRLGYGGV